MNDAASTSVSRKGYGIWKDALSEEELEALKVKMTVKPFNQMTSAQKDEEPGFPLFTESNRKIYIPKSYGLAEYGIPDEDKMPAGDDIDIVFAGALRPEQMEPIHAYLAAARNPAEMGGIINLVCGQGKCLAKNTPVLMFDGGIKMAQDVVVGDLLMGDDSAPRRVVSTCSGREKMYTVVNGTDGTSYTVNASHILSLITRGHPQRTLDMVVTDYLALDDATKGGLFGYRATVDKFGGTPPDTSLFTAFMAGCRHNKRASQSIPNIYIYASKPLRFAYLRGLATACGRSIDGGALYVFKTLLAKPHLHFIANSIGLSTTETAEGFIGVDNLSFQNMLDGDLTVPTHRLMYPIEVVERGMGDYYGFELEGNNRRFLLGDFTVTHNTVCALYIIAELKKKALIVVHKDFLLNQWKERIEQFLPTARVGLIKAKTCDISGQDIVIGSLQSLSMKSYSPELFESFGLICVDECHRTGAEVFSRVYKRINVRYSLGLSATVNRKDGLTKVFKWHIGEIVFKGDKRKDVVRVDVKEYAHTSIEYCQNVLMFNGKVNMSRMINNICDFQPRVQFLVQCILEVLQAEPERKVLVLSDRRKHLDSIRVLLEENAVSNGFYYGGMKQEALKESETRQVLLATYAFCAEGLDVAKLDTLVLASPKSDIVQSLGRILREKETNRLHVPLVIDIVDTFSLFPSQAAKRLKYYKSQKYNVVRVEEG